MKFVCHDLQFYLSCAFPFRRRFLSLLSCLALLFMIKQTKIPGERSLH